ncbi:hypothetical protein EC973_005052 [Apophysomyces ossiformis]|uniref:Uncharacterized protein n=1 Tax=Apophysomyces ossiformis TaxID=679940 RepID=A0A8H7ERN8_9FUNG|nr:hypothetical protein EC973_005052 [Apophysomyces ossiformis]
MNKWGFHCKRFVDQGFVPAHPLRFAAKSPLEICNAASLTLALCVSRAAKAEDVRRCLQAVPLTAPFSKLNATILPGALQNVDSFSSFVTGNKVRLTKGVSVILQTLRMVEGKLKLADPTDMLEARSSTANAKLYDLTNNGLYAAIGKANAKVVARLEGQMEKNHALFF